jgi:protein-disulfide isomerase
MAIAGKMGLDLELLKRDIGSAEVMTAVQRNQALAQRLGLSGTPAFVIGDEVVPGSSDLETFKELVELARRR